MPRLSGSQELSDPPDSGSATVWMVLLIALTALLGTAGLALGQAVTARHRAGAAADLAALAAADNALGGEAAACAQASSVARAQEAHVVACAVEGDIADVLVEVPFSGLLGPLPAPVGRARAGPATSPP